MLKNKIGLLPGNLITAFEFIKVFFFVYCFLLSIDMMGISFKASKDTLQPLLAHTTSNPFLGLIIGIMITSVI